MENEGESKSSDSNSHMISMLMFPVLLTYAPLMIFFAGKDYERCSRLVSQRRSRSS